MMNTNKLYLKVLEARNLPAKDFTLAHLASSDPFVKVWIKGTNQVYQTNVVKHSLNPVWNTDFNFSVPSSNAVLCFTVYDHDQVTANDFLGEGEILLDQYLNRGLQDVWVQLLTKSTGLGLGLSSILGGNLLKQNYKRSKGDVHFQINYSSGQMGTYPQANIGFSQPMPSSMYPQTTSFPQQTSTFSQPVMYPQTSSIYPQTTSFPQQTSTFSQPVMYPQTSSIYPQTNIGFSQPMPNSMYPQTTSFPQQISPYPQGYPLQPQQNFFSTYPFK